MATRRRALGAKLTEADITKQIKGYLESLGWHGIRLQSGTVRGITRGTFITLNKKGTPDWVFFKKDRYCFVEMKAPGKTLSEDQVKWFAWAESLGMPTLWADGLGSFINKFSLLEGEGQP